MNVLSLFDGMSCGQQALQKVGINIDNYFASEIDKYAIQVTMANFPNTVQLGSVINLDGYSLPKIDLLIGGSPCQSFSFAGKRKGMSTKDEQEILTLNHYLQLKNDGFEFEGQSYLFWEYMRLYNEIKPKYFLLENVIMVEKWKKILSKAIGYEPIEINSSLVSGQNRKRLYWTNIGKIPSGMFGEMINIIEQPKDKGILLRDILQDNVDEKYFLSNKMLEYFDKVTKESIVKKRGYKYCPTFGDKKSFTITTREGNRIENNFVIDNNRPRRLTPVECERLQNVKDNYTNHVSNTQRYKMLGNGWTIDIIAHIFSYLKNNHE